MKFKVTVTLQQRDRGSGGEGGGVVGEVTG